MIRLRILPGLLLLLLLHTSGFGGQARTLVRFDLDSLLSRGFPEYQPKLGGARVGLVMSGGGARGLAQIGALKILENSDIEVDLIAGTSMGGVVGGLWAAGFTADSIELLVKDVDWSSFFSDRPKRSNLFMTQRDEGEKHLLTLRFDGFKPTIPTALTAGQKLTSLLNKLSIEANYGCRHDFDRLRIPLRICAVDILTAKPVIIHKGNLADALRATMSVPLAFTPLEIDSMMLMDGGLLMPIPVEVARDAGANVVIALNTTSGLLEKDQISDAIDIANQTTTIMQLATRNNELSRADVVVTPDLGGHLATDFNGIDDMIAAGESAMLEALPDIRAKIDTERYLRGDTVSVRVDSISAPEYLRTNATVIDLTKTARTENLLTVFQIRQAALQILNSGTVSHLEVRHVESDSLSLLIFESCPMSPTASVGWVGNETVSDATIHSAIGLRESTENGIDAIQDVYHRFSALYRNRGYDLMEIDSVRYDILIDSTTFYISEGLISRIMITGNDRTRGWVIKRNFTLDPGEPFNLEAAEKGMSNIYSTGLFERVNFDVERRGNEALVRIEVKEKEFNNMRIGAHYHEHYHAETFVDFADANVLGLSHELFFRVQYGEKRKYYSLNLKADRIFETYLTYRIKLYHERLKRDRYEDNVSLGINRERRTGAMVAFGQQISKLGTVTIEARAERLRIDLPIFAGLLHRSLRSITLRSKVDNLDKYPYPEAGVAAHFYLELAYDAFGGEDRYKKAYFDWRAQIPLSDKFGLQPSFAIGASDVALPSFEKFFLGGNRNLYGYHNDALEGDKLFRGSLGLRYALPYGFYATGRYDVGNVWSTLEEIRFDNLLHCSGVELSYDSPLGPISVSYGRAEREYERVYIDVGYDF